MTLMRLFLRKTLLERLELILREQVNTTKSLDDFIATTTQRIAEFVMDEVKYGQNALRNTED